MSRRIDTSSRLIAAPASRVYEAFAQPGALARWLPPPGMRGDVLSFDFRTGGGYRMRLTYETPAEGRGKTSPSTDEVGVRLVRIEPGERIVQEVDFAGDDPSFTGTMRMTWRFEPAAGGTVVTVRAENVPDGIRPEDHQAGLDASLANLARLVEADEEAPPGH